MCIIELGDCLDYIQSTKYIVSSDEYSDKYEMPVLTAKKNFFLGHTNDKHGIFRASKDNTVIPFGDFTTEITWVDFPFKVKSSACKILIPKDGLNIYFAMRNIKFDNSNHKRYWIYEYSELKIALADSVNESFILNSLESIEEPINTKNNHLSNLNELVKSRFIGQEAAKCIY